MTAIDYVYEKKGRFQLSSNQLKIIAMFSMLIDHIGLMLILNGKLYGYSNELYSYAIILDSTKYLRILYRCCRIIGRISFPIFCFCIVEGFLRSKNHIKYYLRIFFLAVISEIPFDLMIKNTFFYLDCQNVIWSYFISLIMLSLIKRFNGMQIIQLMCVVFFSFVAFFTKVDYGAYGIVLVAMIYFMRYDKNLRSIVIAIISFIISIKADFGFGALSAIFIHFYNGKKGTIDIGNLFYLFYPCHMLILFGIVYLSYMFKG